MDGKRGCGEGRGAERKGGKATATATTAPTATPAATLRRIPLRSAVAKNPTQFARVLQSLSDKRVQQSLRSVPQQIETVQVA